MRLRLYRIDHPILAESLGNLASTLRRLGEVDQVKELGSQVAAIQERPRASMDEAGIAASSEQYTVASFLLRNGRRVRAFDDY
jgi:hypothetical protein